MHNQKIYGKGSASSGALMHPSLQDEKDFVALPLDFQVKDIAISSTFILALSQEGDLYIWGTIEKEIVLTPLLLQKKVIRIKCGWSHALFETGGKIFGIGSNQNLQLGFNGDKYVSKPQLIDQQKVDIFACGFRQSYLIKGGILLGCGQTRKFELGVSQREPQKWRVICPNLKHFESEVVDMVCGKRFLLMLCEDGRIWSLGYNEHNIFNNCQITHIIVPELVYSEIKQIACGWAHVVLLQENNIVKSYGRNNLGQLGRKETEAVQFVLEAGQNIKSVRSGSQFSFAITTRGRLFGWGWNQHLNIQPEKIWSYVSPVEIKTQKRCENVWTLPATTIVKYSHQ